MIWVQILKIKKSPIKKPPNKPNAEAAVNIKKDLNNLSSFPREEKIIKIKPINAVMPRNIFLM